MMTLAYTGTYNLDRYIHAFIIYVIHINIYIIIYVAMIYPCICLNICIQICLCSHIYILGVKGKYTNGGEYSMMVV